MNSIRRFLLLICLTAALSPFVSAQTGEQRVLAKINNQNVTAGELDQTLQIALDQLEPQIAELRELIFEKIVSEILFANEAAARGVSIEKLLDAEVNAKIAAPSDARVAEVYTANALTFGNIALETVKPRIVASLRRDAAETGARAFAESLKTKYKFAPGVDAANANLKPTDVVATIGANKILASTVLERAKPHEYNQRLQVYQQVKTALDGVLFNKLIFQIAEQRKLQPEDIIQIEISDKLREPTEAEALKFYNERKTALGGETFENLKTQILSYLSDERREQLIKALRERLSKQNAVQILLVEPQPPVLKIETAGAPSKGAATAPVTVVMFTDFQCSACARTHPILSEVLKANQTKTRFVVRNFPLETVHENAFRAAQAAQAARRQNKFFEYTELLYQNQNRLDDASLKKYAAQIGLNAKQFEIDLNGGKFDAVIRRDLADGDVYGIRATPTVYVNGVVVSDLSKEGLQAAIDRALLKK